MRKFSLMACVLVVLLASNVFAQTQAQQDSKDAAESWVTGSNVATLDNQAEATSDARTAADDASDAAITAGYEAQSNGASEAQLAEGDGLVEDGDDYYYSGLNFYIDFLADGYADLAETAWDMGLNYWYGLNNYPLDCALGAAEFDKVVLYYGTNWMDAMSDAADEFVSAKGCYEAAENSYNAIEVE